MANFIPQNIIDQILEANDIVPLVEEYVRLDKKSSADYFGLCPFHSEKTPSFSVSPSKQIFYCFGCHKGGNAIKFIQEIEHLSFPQALRFLADKKGITLPSQDQEAYTKLKEKQAKQFDILLAAARFFYRSFQSKEAYKAKAYMEKRGFRGEIMTKFGLGFADFRWDSLANQLLSQGFDRSDLLTSGLIRQDKQGKPYDFFRNRVMFPIFDSFGQLIAFGGRLIDQGEAKYINSPETPVYHKGRHLFALNFARKTKHDAFLLTEGYLDVLSLHQAGFDNAIAGLGTALTADQAKLIKRFRDKLILSYDADSAGRNASLKALNICESQGLDVRVLQIPDKMDPDDYIKKYGPARFQALIDKAIPGLDFRLELAYQDSLDQTGKQMDPVVYQELACKILQKISSKVVQELYAGKVAEKLSVPKDTVLREVVRLGKMSAEELPVDLSRYSAHSKLVKPAQAQFKERELARLKLTEEESLLLMTLALQPDLYASLGSQVTVDDFSTNLPKGLVAEFLQLAAEGKLSLAKLLGSASLSDSDREAFNRSLMEVNQILEKTDRTDYLHLAKSSLEVMRRERIKQRKQELLQELTGLQADQLDRRRSLLAEMDELLKLERKKDLLSD